MSETGAVEFVCRRGSRAEAEELGRVNTKSATMGLIEITGEQYEKIKESLPVQRGNVKLQNLQVVNAILYVAEQGCKWRGLPSRFGNWHHSCPN